MFALRSIYRLALLTVLTCAFALAGCSKTKNNPGDDSDQTSAPSGSTPQNTPTGPTDAQPDLTYTVKEYVEERKKDFSFLFNKHPGKVIELSGVVNSWGVRSDGLFVYLDNGESFQAFGIDGKHPWVDALPKQVISIRTIPLNKKHLWQVVAVKGPPPATLTAEQYCKERKADGDAFHEKYRKGSIIVTGIIAQVKDNAESLDVKLAAGSDETLNCFMFTPSTAPIPPTESQKAGLKPGMKVKVLGSPYGLSFMISYFLEPAP